MEIDVLYEDNHLIAVRKPAGVLTQGDESGDVSLYDMVKDYIRVKKGKEPLFSGNAKPRSETAVSASGVFLGLLHRLDRNTSGIVLFAKTSKGASRLSEQFRRHKIEKIYHAIVTDKPEKNKGTLLNFIKKDEKKKKAFISKNGEGKPAELDYEVIDYIEKYSLLKIRIKTGKFHQIRAQLAAIGCPILGDIKYGASSVLPDKSIALCATSLSFKKATAEEDKKISIPIPKDWGQFIR